MTREEIREKFDAITDPYNQKNDLYDVLDLLGIKYKKTNCKNCILDYFHMAQEELGIIEDASEESNFNEWAHEDNQPSTVLKYVWPRPVSWKGHIINDRTPESVKREFHKTHKGFYIEQATIPFNETN